MNNVKLCVESKLTVATGRLQPTVLSAILSLMESGVYDQSARLVKNKCAEIDSQINWESRIPAICNAMRNLRSCGVKIVSEDRDFLDFTIEFNMNCSKKDKLIDPIKVSTSKKNQKKKEESKKQVFKGWEALPTKKKNDAFDAANGNIKRKIETLALDKIKDKNIKKLLIIGCSDSKDISSPIKEIKANHLFFEEINDARKKSIIEYRRLLNDSKNENYFKKKRKRKIVDSKYFLESIDGNLFNALDLYGSNHSPFYKTEMKSLYKLLRKEYNFQILIVSGLYGVLDSNDLIIDYHLEVNKSLFWTKSDVVHHAIVKYIVENQIDNDMVFYSLSNKYVKVIGPTNLSWNNLWWNYNGRGHRQGADMKYFLEKLIE